VGVSRQWRTGYRVIEVEREGGGLIISVAGDHAAGLEYQAHIASAALQVRVVAARRVTGAAGGVGAGGRGPDHQGDDPNREKKKAD